MKKILVIALAFLAIFATILFAAEQTKPTDEREKLFEIAQKLQVRKPHPVQRISKEQQDFCRTFLEDLQAKQGIEFVEPIVTTSDYNDPALQAYLGKCPKLQLNKTVAFEPKIWDYAKTLPEEEREKFGRVWYMTTNFNLYKVDIDNDPRNGKECVFYGEGMYDAKRNMESDLTDYKVFDLETCKIRTSQSVSEKMHGVTRRQTHNMNRIIQYKQKYYIFNVTYFEKEHAYSLWLYGWKEEKGGKILPICSFESKRN
jgi:hypothetical protein